MRSKMAFSVTPPPTPHLRLFDALKVPYTVVNIDAFQYAKDNMGNKYRAALSSVTGTVA